MMRQQKTIATKKKVGFKRKCQEFVLNYGFISSGEFHTLSVLCVISGDRLSNEALKPSNCCVFGTELPLSDLNTTFLQFFKFSNKGGPKSYLPLVPSVRCSHFRSIYLSFMGLKG